MLTFNLIKILYQTLVLDMFSVFIGSVKGSVWILDFQNMVWRQLNLFVTHNSNPELAVHVYATIKCSSKGTGTVLKTKLYTKPYSQQ